RRGRGRGGANLAAVPNAEGGLPLPSMGAVAPAAPPAMDDEQSVVPRGVVAHELMPAAGGGRGRRRGHRGRRVRAMGGEPFDPQLISPMNPVRKPGFDQD